jgi:excisionase family DNA binding protein
MMLHGTPTAITSPAARPESASSKQARPRVEFSGERLVGLPEICVRTGFDRGTIRRLAKRGKFPALRQKGDRRVFVTESELLAWMRA